MSDFVLRAIVQEVTPAGALVRDWDSMGEIAAVETTVPICFRSRGPGNDYLSSIHPNAVDVKANGPGSADDQLIVSARHNDAVYGIRFESEAVDWKLGGTPTPQSLTIVGDPLGGPRRQHDVRVLPNGHITMFDNRTNFTTATVPFATVTGAARFVEYAIDETAHTATLVRQISNPFGFFSGATGSARVQSDGGVVICWGALPGTVFSEYDAAGQVVFEVHMQGLNSSYRAVKEPLGSFDVGELRQTAGG